MEEKKILELTEDEASAAAGGIAQFYTIRRGDSLQSIARRFGTSVDRLVQLNNIKNPDIIYVNQRIRLY